MLKTHTLLRLGLIGGLLTLLATGCSSVPAKPQVSGQIYDSRADGEQQLKAALAKAQKEQKRVLLDLGANWCSDSQAMYRLLQTDAAIRQEIQQHFVLVLVDVNEQDGPARNRPLLQHLGNPLTRGIPVLLVLDSKGELLNKEPAERLNDSAYSEPARVLAYLQKWATSLKPSGTPSGI